MIELNGERRRLADWCRQYGVSYGRTVMRLRRGYTIEQALGLGQLPPGNLPSERDNLTITIDGRTRNLDLWCEELRLDRQLVCERLARGWTVQDALYREPWTTTQLSDDQGASEQLESLIRRLKSDAKLQNALGLQALNGLTLELELIRRKVEANEGRLMIANKPAEVAHFKAPNAKLKERRWQRWPSRRR